MSGLKYVPRGPYGYLIEKDLIKVAVINAENIIPGNYSTNSTNSLLYNVVLDPRYIPKDFTDYKIRKVRGRRIGRTIDILLEEPIFVN